MFLYLPQGLSDVCHGYIFLINYDLMYRWDVLGVLFLDEYDFCYWKKCVLSKTRLGCWSWEWLNYLPSEWWIIHRWGSSFLYFAWSRLKCFSKREILFLCFYFFVVLILLRVETRVVYLHFLIIMISEFFRFLNLWICLFLRSPVLKILFLFLFSIIFGVCCYYLREFNGIDTIMVIYWLIISSSFFRGDDSCEMMLVCERYEGGGYNR